MKRYSPILFIWILSFLGSSMATLLTFRNGENSEFFAWATATTFIANLIIYHFYQTRNADVKDSDIDE